MAVNNIIYKISALDMLTPALNKMDSAAKSLTSTIAGALSVAGAIQFGKSILDAGTKVQDARTGLTTLLKDAAAANTVIERTMEDAARTPFDFETLLTGNKALISTGLSANKARLDILALGNAVAATGGGSDELNRMTQNLQQIRNVGKASQADLKQFGFAGINIYRLLAESTGKSVAKLKEMPITYDMITDALQKASEAGGVFEGALDRMGQNVSIKLSNIGDNLFIIYNNIFMKSSGFISKILDGINKVLIKIKEFTSNTTKMREFGNILTDIATAITLVAAGWGTWNLITAISNINLQAIIFSLRTITALEAAATLGLTALFAELIDKGDEFETHTSAMLFRLGKGWAYLASSVIYTIELIKTRSVKAAKDAFEKNMAEYEEKAGAAFKKSTDKNLKELERYMEAADKIRGRKVTASMTKELDDDKMAMEKQVGLLAKAEKQFGKNSDAYKKIQNALDIGDLNKGDKTTTIDNTTTKKLTTGVSGPKITTINISMKNLVGQFKVETNNMKEGADNAKDIVIKALTQALSDSQAIVN